MPLGHSLIINFYSTFLLQYLKKNKQTPETVNSYSHLVGLIFCSKLKKKVGETTAVFETKNVLHDLNLINSTQSVFTKSYRHTLTADSPNTFDFFLFPAMLE